MEKSSENIVYVNEFVDLVGPETEMLGPVRDERSRTNGKVSRYGY